MYRRFTIHFIKLLLCVVIFFSIRLCQCVVQVAGDWTVPGYVSARAVTGAVTRSRASVAVRRGTPDHAVNRVRVVMNCNSNLKFVLCGL